MIFNITPLSGGYLFKYGNDQKNLKGTTYKGFKIKFDITEDQLKNLEETVSKTLTGDLDYHTEYGKLQDNNFKKLFEHLYNVNYDQINKQYKLNYLGKDNLAVNVGYYFSRIKPSFPDIKEHFSENKFKYGIGATALIGAGFLLRNRKSQDDE